jgi:hypothetical protein
MSKSNNSNNSNKFVTIVVLNDGETFTDISGCSVCIIPQEDYERVIAEGGDARDFSPVVEIGLDNMTLPMSREDHIAFEDSLAQARAIARRQAIEGEDN